MKQRCLIVGAITFLLLSIIVPNTVAEIAFEGKFGLEGHIKPQAWTYIVVDARNTGNSFVGSIRTRVPRDGRTTFASSLDLPTNSDKRIYLYVYPQSGIDKCRISLVPKNKIQETTGFELIPDYPDITHAIGRIGKDVGLRGLLSASPKTSWMEVQILEDDLPDRWMGYDALDALILASPNIRALAPSQKDALRNWVSTGGKLIVTTGADWQWLKGTFIEDMLPVKPTRSVSTNSLPGLESYADGEDLPSGATFVICGSDLIRRDKSRILARHAGSPLIIEAPYEMGKVVFLAFNPGDPAFKSAVWPGASHFWERLLDIKLAKRVPPVSYVSAKQQIAKHITRITGAIPIGLGWIALFMMAYILVIGPVDYFLTRRIKKLAIGAVSILFAVFVFSVVAFAITYTGKSADIQVKQLTTLDVSLDSGMMRGTALSGFFAPKTGLYTFKADEPAAFVNLLQFGDFGRSGGHSGREFFVFGRSMEGPVSELRSDPGKMKGFVSQWCHPGPSDWPDSAQEIFREALDSVGGTLTECIIVFNTYVYYVGTLRSSDFPWPLRSRMSRRVKFSDIFSRRQLNYFLNDYASLSTTRPIHKTAMPAYLNGSQFALLGLTLVKDTESSPAADETLGYFYRGSMMIPRLNLREQVDTGSIYLIGWTQKAPYNFVPTGQRAKASNDCMVRMKLDRRFVTRSWKDDQDN